MITHVNSWDLVNHNWPIDTRNSPLQLAKDRKYMESLYLFRYRDELFTHILGGRWNLFPQQTPARYIDTWT